MSQSVSGNGRPDVGRMASVQNSELRMPSTDGRGVRSLPVDGGKERQILAEDPQIGRLAGDRLGRNVRDAVAGHAEPARENAEAEPSTDPLGRRAQAAGRAGRMGGKVGPAVRAGGAGDRSGRE